RADLFALGIVMWEMLTGKRLFKAATGLETLEKVRAAHVLPPSTINPAVPPALDAIVQKALQKAPTDRFRSAAHMLTALEGVVGRLAFGAFDLAATMATLFPDEAPLWGDEDTLPLPRPDGDWLRDEEEKEAPAPERQEAVGELIAPLRLPPAQERARS